MLQKKKKRKKERRKSWEEKNLFSTSWWKQRLTYDTCFAILTVNNSYNCNQWKRVSILATRTARARHAPNHRILQSNFSPGLQSQWRMQLSILHPPAPVLSQTLTRVSPDLLLLCYLGTPTVMDTLLRGLRVGIQPLPLQLVNISFSDLLWASTKTWRLLRECETETGPGETKRKGLSLCLLLQRMLPAVHLKRSLWKLVSDWARGPLWRCKTALMTQLFL